MSTVSLTTAQRAARDAFKRAILEGEAGGYPECVTLVPAVDMDADTFARTVGGNLSAGIAVVFVREDGHEMLLAPDARTGFFGWFDRRRGRTRLHIAFRGETEQQPAFDHDRVVHLARGEELKQLITGDLCPV